MSRGNGERQAAAAWPSIALARPISILRGFSASGTSRTRSMCSRPFSRHRLGDAHVVGELEAALEGAGGDAAVQDRGLVLGLRLAAGHDELAVAGLDRELVLGEAGHREGDAVGILAGLLDVVGRVGVRADVGRHHLVEDRREPVEADGRTVERSEIKVTHGASSKKRYGLRALRRGRALTWILPDPWTGAGRLGSGK